MLTQSGASDSESEKKTKKDKRQKIKAKKDRSQQAESSIDRLADSIKKASVTQLQPVGQKGEPLISITHLLFCILNRCPIFVLTLV